MKISALIPAVALAFGAASITLPSIAEAKGPVRVVESQKVEFTEQDAETLAWMREEEKLARDVYINLFQLWNKPVFGNISGSEQRHFDTIGDRMEQYRVPDPSLPEIGAFSNPEIQSLYDALMEQGSISATEAFWVGATIEDVDIRDLQIAIENTDISYLKTTYGNLLEGSKNHLRAFVRQLDQAGVTYEPQFIDPVLYEAIINGG